jgi:L-arabinonolactonase
VQIKRVGSVRCKIGEGPLWDAVEQALFFVDIRGQVLHRYDYARRTFDSWSQPKQIGCLALRRSGGAVVALADGFYSFDFRSGQTEVIARPENDTSQFNDGKVDPQGRFVVGTASGFSSPVPGGSIYRLDANSQMSRIGSEIFIFNGPCWSPDGGTFYFADSRLGTVYACDYDGVSGRLANRREFVKTEAVGGHPDGATVDADGYYWVTIVMASKIACYRPDGKLERTVDVPVPWPSSLMFGGPKLDQLYFTSIDGSVFDRHTTLESGGLFVIDGLGVRGVAERRFAG